MTKTQEVYKSAVIGCGRIGCEFNDSPNPKYGIMTHSQAYSLNKRTKLIALVDVDEKKVKKYSQKYDVKDYLDWRVMLEKENPDILSIC
ncbi:MAG: Gfo/Idh/MocA family oxidoreductase, partial [Nanoarchaeota archaeon]